MNKTHLLFKLFTIAIFAVVMGIYFYSYHDKELTLEEMSIIKIEVQEKTKSKHYTETLDEENLLRTFIENRLLKESPSAELALFVYKEGNYIHPSFNSSSVKGFDSFVDKIEKIKGKADFIRYTLQKRVPTACLYYEKFTPEIVQHAVNRYRYLARFKGGGLTSPSYRYDQAAKEYCSSTSAPQ